MISVPNCVRRVSTSHGESGAEFIDAKKMLLRVSRAGATCECLERNPENAIRGRAADHRVPALRASFAATIIRARNHPDGIVYQGTYKGLTWPREDSDLVAVAQVRQTPTSNLGSDGHESRSIRLKLRPNYAPFVLYDRFRREICCM